jgi:hypothetical protein
LRQQGFLIGGDRNENHLDAQPQPPGGVGGRGMSVAEAERPADAVDKAAQ